MIGVIGIGLGILILLVIIACLFAWYRVVPPSQAHLVVTPTKKMVCSADPKVQKDGGGATYFAISSSIPFIGREVRVMDVTIKELIVEQETYEKDQARFRVKSSTKYRIMDVQTASETFSDDEELREQLKEIIQSSVRAITVKYSVVEARANKKKMSDEIETEITDDLAKWGLHLVNFVLVDFQDTTESEIISNISKRREVEIEAETRELNAVKLKNARLKEAETEEEAKKREIQKDEVIAMREQDKLKLVSKQEKEAKEAEYEVKKVQTVKQAEIDKEKSLVEANQRKEVEEINKEQKKLEGEGERLKLEEQAKGNAAEIRENGKAEAEAKKLLQEALNKFGDNAIRALVAEKIVVMQKEVGVASAEALKAADVKVFAGTGDGQTGFDIGQMVQAMGVSNENLAESVLNRIKRPNDLGIDFSNKSKQIDKSKPKEKASAKA